MRHTKLVLQAIGVLVPRTEGEVRVRGVASHHYASHVVHYGQWIAVARLVSLWLSERKIMGRSNAAEEEVWYKRDQHFRKMHLDCGC